MAFDPTGWPGSTASPSCWSALSSLATARSSQTSSNVELVRTFASIILVITAKPTRMYRRQDAASRDLPPGAAFYWNQDNCCMFFLLHIFGDFDMQNDLNTRPSIDDRRSGIGAGTIAPIIAAVLIVGALFMWAPWNNGSQTNPSNNAPATTTGSANTARSAAPATTP